MYEIKVRKLFTEISYGVPFNACSISCMSGTERFPSINQIRVMSVIGQVRLQMAYSTVLDYHQHFSCNSRVSIKFTFAFFLNRNSVKKTYLMSFKGSSRLHLLDMSF